MSPPAYEVIEVEAAGSIAGVVQWVGAIPEMPDVAVHVHPEVCGAEQPSRALRVSRRNRVRDVVVELVDPSRGRAITAPEQAPELAQRSCRFEPHVLAVAVGWPIAFTNEDAVIHNARVYRGDRTVFDLGLPEAGAREERAVEEPGALRVVCDVGHGWQRAWIHAFDHPYFAVTGEEGSFRISEVPPGRYTLRIWHEGWRVVGSEAGRARYSRAVVLSRSVSVSPRQETTVDFELSQQAGELAGD